METKLSKLTETGRTAAESTINSQQPVSLKNLNSSYRLTGHLVDAAVLGSGVGLSWWALKKMVERAYQRRMEKALMENTVVADTYKGSVTPVTNEFVMEHEEPYKIEKKADAVATEKTFNEAVIDPKAMDLNPKTNPGAYAVLKRDASLQGKISAEMATKPGIYNSLAFASIPALVALSAWGANSLAKSLSKDAIPDIVPNIQPEVRKARKKYRDAAELLRYITSGKAYEKEAAMQKDAAIQKEAFPWIPAMWAGAGLLGAGGYVYDKYKTHHKPEGMVIPSPELSSNPATNAGLNLALGLGALALLYPGYKFVQSMRKAYNDRKDQVSEATRAAQLWWPLRKQHQERFVRLQAALAQEPELLDNLEQTLREKQLLPAEQPTQTV